MCDMLPHPRPWSISLSLIWKDDTGPGFRNFLEYIFEATRPDILATGTPATFPGDQMEMSKTVLHCTALAVLEFGETDVTDDSLRELTREVLGKVANNTMLLELSAAWKSAVGLESLGLTATKIKIYDTGSFVQFASSSKVGAFRMSARDVLRMKASELATYYANRAVTSTVDGKKNAGCDLYGAIARAPNKSAVPKLLREIPLTGKFVFTFEKIHLLASDRWLTNERGEKEDFSIPV